MSGRARAGEGASVGGVEPSRQELAWGHDRAPQGACRAYCGGIGRHRAPHASCGRVPLPRLQTRAQRTHPRASPFAQTWPAGKQQRRFGQPGRGARPAEIRVPTSSRPLRPTATCAAWSWSCFSAAGSQRSGLTGSIGPACSPFTILPSLLWRRLRRTVEVSRVSRGCNWRACLQGFRGLGFRTPAFHHLHGPRPGRGHTAPLCLARPKGVGSRLCAGRRRIHYARHTTATHPQNARTPRTHT